MELELVDNTNSKEASPIREIKNYANEEGMRVTAFIPWHEQTGCADIENQTFCGAVGLNTPRGQVEFGFDFPHGYTLTQCFEDFDKVAEASIQEKMEEQKEENLIVTPGQMSGGDIIMP